MTMTQDKDFVSLLAENQRRLLHYVLTLLPSIQDAEDVVQETSIVLFEKFSEYQPGTNFFAWAARIAFNKVRNLRRSSVFPAMVLDEDVLNALTNDSPMADSEELSEALRECLDKLTQQDRTLFSRRYASGISGRSLAGELQRAESSISQSLRRIRVALANCMERKLSRMNGGA
jgi:RNA polymerase sigma-70 factor (ECF subfamily)